MVDINDYREEKSCVYKSEEYLVRDNGAVLRKPRSNKMARKLDNIWTFGKPNIRGYLQIGSERVNRIVATAFHGEPPTQEHIADHIDTNRQNNRPSNLRWVSKFENAVQNEFTRKKIEYLTGVDIIEFLKNPAEYRDLLSGSDISWMRVVTEEEAKACLENIKKLTVKKTIKQVSNNRGMGEWIFETRDPDAKQRYYEQTQIIDSLTALAKQKDWGTPTEFVCCPNEIQENPIECYFKNLAEGVVFSSNRYGDSEIVKYALIDNNAIVIITAMPSGVKSFALAKITYENNYYLHSSLGAFFTKEGAEKNFTLAQGLEWTGGETFDDYC